MHELTARAVAVARRVFRRPDSADVDWRAEQSGIENQPARRPLPQQPGVIHARRSVRSAYDKASRAIIHLISNPKGLCLAVTCAGRLRFRWSLRDQRILHV